MIQLITNIYLVRFMYSSLFYCRIPCAYYLVIRMICLLILEDISMIDMYINMSFKCVFRII